MTLSRDLCLLIVDDESDLLEAIAETCSHLGYSVLQATSAQEALSLLNDKPVDVVLTDVRMKPMNGFELLEAARLIYPSVPFVLWTGFWDKEQEAKARTYPRLEMMSKPFSLKQVQEVLGKLQSMKAPAPNTPLKGDAVRLA